MTTSTGNEARDGEDEEEVEMFGSKLHGIATMGLALAMMTVAVLTAQPDVLEGGKPSLISMLGDKIAACKQNSVETSFGFLGCNPEMASRTTGNDVVRIVGGSRFVSARKF